MDQELKILGAVQGIASGFVMALRSSEWLQPSTARVNLGHEQRLVLGAGRRAEFDKRSLDQARTCYTIRRAALVLA
jgi:hypothetical protein